MKAMKKMDAVDREKERKREEEEKANGQQKESKSQNKNKVLKEGQLNTNGVQSYCHNTNKQSTIGCMS